MTTLDRIPVAQLADKYGIVKSVLEDRMNRLSIKPSKIDNQFYISSKQLELLDQLDVHLEAGGSIAEFDMSSTQAPYRGRVQAQGDDIDILQNGGYSYPWAKRTPVTEQEGLLFLDKIQAECSKEQQKERKQAFSKAKRFVKTASEQGGVGPESQPHSFQDRKRKFHNSRVDIEIAIGRTFVPKETE